MSVPLNKIKEQTRDFDIHVKITNVRDLNNNQSEWTLWDWTGELYYLKVTKDSRRWNVKEGEVVRMWSVNLD